MRIVFFGVPDLGIICLDALIRAGKNVIAVVPPNPAHPAHNMMLDTTRRYNIPAKYFINSPKEPEFIASLRELNPDVALVGSFNDRLPKEILDIPKLGIINCHPSLLPEYRGGNPYFHVIMNKEKETGITFHYMDETFDTGDIIIQVKVDVYPDETLGTLFNRQNLQSAQMMVEIIERLERGETLPRTPQPKEGNFKKAPNFHPEKGHSIIDWLQDAEYIERFTRACNPFYGATTYYRGCPVKIWTGVYSPNHQEKKFKPGTIINVSDDNMAVATGKGLFFPTTIQLGTYMITNIRDFIKRTTPRLGEAFADRP